MNMEFKVKGLKELSAFLNQLPEDIERKIMRGALREAAKVVQASAVEKLGNQVETGLLRDGLKVGTRLMKGGVIMARVRTTGKHSYVANWIEHGAGAHVIYARNKKYLFISNGGKFITSVMHPGITPTPFMRPAMHENATAAIQAAAAYVKLKLTKRGVVGADEVDIEIEGGNE